MAEAPRAKKVTTKKVTAPKKASGVKPQGAGWKDGGKHSKRDDEGNVINGDNRAIMVAPAHRAGAYGQASNYKKEDIGPGERDFNKMLSSEGFANMSNATFYAKHAKSNEDGMVLAPQDRSEDSSRQPGM